MTQPAIANRQSRKGGVDRRWTSITRLAEHRSGQQLPCRLARDLGPKPRSPEPAAASRGRPTTSPEVAGRSVVSDASLASGRDAVGRTRSFVGLSRPVHERCQRCQRCTRSSCSALEFKPPNRATDCVESPHSELTLSYEREPDAYSTFTLRLELGRTRSGTPPSLSSQLTAGDSETAETRSKRRRDPASSDTKARSQAKAVALMTNRPVPPSADSSTLGQPRMLVVDKVQGS